MTTKAPFLNLVVLQADDPQALARVYEALGGVFQLEQHEKGPPHFSCELGHLVLEIYPKQQASPGTPGVRLGFAVHDLDAVLNAVVAAGARLVSAPKVTPWGRRAVITDTEGHRLDLTEAN